MDHAATTYVKDEVLTAMLPYFGGCFGNPSGVYAGAREAKKALEDARAKIAELIGAESPREIYFTSGGTEGDNWALRGVMIKAENRGHIITSRAEHHAVLEACVMLERQGVEVTYIAVDGGGRVSAEAVAAALREDTALVSIMSVNNEVGTVNPVAELAAAAREAGALFHTDAVAAAGHIPLNCKDFDMLTISAHKFYGPKGVGAIYIREGTGIAPLLAGGKQERERRAGTENVAGAVGMAAALELACEDMRSEEKRIGELRDDFEKMLINGVPGIIFNGDAKNRLAGYCNICLPVAANAALVALDMAGVECSSGSACMTGGVMPSHVLMAMGRTEEEARHALRITLGARTTLADMEYAAKQIIRICGGAAV